MEITEPMETALALFREHNGILRTSDALRLGIHPRVLYILRDAGLIEPLSRGLYRLTELPPLANPDLVTVAHKIPQAVVCLISALAFHGLTTQIPHAVDIALPPQVAQPALAYPPLRVFRFSGLAFSEGIETHMLDDTPVRIYAPPKCVADSFKYRRKLGLDIALEALRAYRAHSAFQVDTLLRYAQICRVDNVMRPYLETLL
jgi:predicted transcriptional regulator of viral defense system